MFDKNDERKFLGTLNRVKTFLIRHLGLPESESIKELLAEATNNQCVIEVSHRPNPNDPEVVYDEIKTTSPVG